MNKRLVKTQYTFGFNFFNLNADNESNKIFSILSNPESVKKIIGDNEIYNKVWNKIVHEEEDYVCRSYDVIEYVFDMDYEDPNEDTNSFVLGFNNGSEQLTEDALRKVYTEVLTPIAKSVNPIIEPSGKFGFYETYSENISGNFSL